MTIRIEKNLSAVVFRFDCVTQSDTTPSSEIILLLCVPVTAHHSLFLIAHLVPFLQFGRPPLVKILGENLGPKINSSTLCRTPVT